LAINVPGEIDATEFPAEAINVPGEIDATVFPVGAVNVSGEIDATVFPAEAVNVPDGTSPDTIAGCGGAITAEIGLIPALEIVDEFVGATLDTAEIGLIPALEIVDEFVGATLDTSELLGAMTLLYIITKT